jgi:hypothetical protein
MLIFKRRVVVKPLDRPELTSRVLLPAGSGPFTLQISGGGFEPQSVALWSGTSLTTTYVATVPKSWSPALNVAIPGQRW